MLTFPSYFKAFRCIAGDCPDTCCRGWEVDLDEDTYFYYQVAPSPFGDRVRSAIREEGDTRYFPLTKDRRCPFLDSQNLCDIYTELGPEHLCVTCREYPRSFAGAGEYEQVDLSLSCPEAARLYFSPNTEIDYNTDEDDLSEFPEISTKEQARLSGILKKRDALLSGMRGPFPWDAILPNEGTRFLMERFTVLSERWPPVLEALKESDPAKFLAQFTALPEADTWFWKLASYLTFRYYIDAFYDGGTTPEETLVRNSLQILLLLCLLRMEENEGSFEPPDMIDTAVFFSRVAEHAEENIQLLKEV